MKRTVYYRVIIISFLALMFMSCKYAQAKVLDRIVAVVNDDIILYSELKKEVEMFKKTVRGRIPLPDSVLERQVLERMIQEKLVDQEMKRLNISVDDATVEAAIERIKANNGWTDEQFRYVLQQRGMTYDDFKSEVKKDLQRSRLMDRVFQSKTVITDDQIDEYLKKHGKELGPSNKVNLSVIFIPKAESINKSPEDILREIRNGADFYQMARRYSKGPGASDGGRLGWIKIDELAEPLKEALKNMKPGDVSPVISMESGYFIVKLEEVEEHKADDGALNVSKAERERIRQMLFKKEINRKFREWLDDLMEKSYIRISL